MPSGLSSADKQLSGRLIEPLYDGQCNMARSTSASIREFQRVLSETKTQRAWNAWLPAFYAFALLKNAVFSFILSLNRLTAPASPLTIAFTAFFCTISKVGRSLIDHIHFCLPNSATKSLSFGVDELLL